MIQDHIAAPNALRASIEAALPLRASRVFNVVVEGRTVWVKCAVEHKFRVWHRWQRVVAGVLRAPLLAMTADTAGSSALAREVRIIGSLRAKGARVPDVFLVEPDWIALSDLGEALDIQINRAGSSAAVVALVEAGAAALARLHRLGAWHGNALLRNVAGPVDQLGFLDFEEDPVRQMSPVHCQTRDVLFYIFSLSRFSRQYSGLHAVGLRVYLKQATPEVVAMLRRVSRLFRPVVWGLKPVRTHTGRDVRQALDALDALAIALDQLPLAPRVEVGWRRWLWITLSIGAIGFGVASLVR